MRKWIISLSCIWAVLLVALFTLYYHSKNSIVIQSDTSATPTEAVFPLISPPPSGNTRAAVVDDFAGSVTATSGGDELPAFRGLALLRRDSLETGAQSWSSLELGEEQFVFIEENSEVSIAQLADDAKSAELTAIGGKIWVSIAKELADDESFEVRTPTCALSVRGTVFAVTYDENSCQVAVYEGTVLLRAEDESSSPILDEHGNEVFLEISGEKAIVTVENGVVTYALQTVLTEEDWAPLYTQGDAGPGGSYDTLRSRLPELIWDDDNSPFAAHEYYARELRAFLNSGKSVYSIMLKDFDCDGAEELAIYWVEIMYDTVGDYSEEAYRLDIYDWDNGEELHFTQEKSEIYGYAWVETIFLSNNGYLAFYTHGNDISLLPGWVYDNSKMYSIEGAFYESDWEDEATFDGSTISESRYIELCEKYGFEVSIVEDDFGPYRIVEAIPGAPVFPYADTQKDIHRLLG